MIRKLMQSLLAVVLSFGIYVGALVTSSPIASVATVGVVATCAVTQVACSKDQLVASAQDVLDTVKSPELQAALAAISQALNSKLLALIGPATNLVQAFKNGDVSNGLQVLNTIFPVIDQIITAVNHDPTIGGFLALANLGIHFIINHTQKSVPKMARVNPEVRKALDYGVQPVWGCQYSAKTKRREYRALCTQ